MDSPINTVGVRELAMIDAAVAMCRAYEGKLQSEPLTANDSLEGPLGRITEVMMITVTIFNGPVRDIFSLIGKSEEFPNTASLKSMITERNKLAASYGEDSISE